jgi:uncharacterized protein YdeI (YjbR/CyaY-like superfamily)
LAEAIDAALGYGWVESQAVGIDDRHRLLRFTPRRPGSRRTKGNRGKVRKLIEEGRMKSASLREVERASTDGRWEQ